MLRSSHSFARLGRLITPTPPSSGLRFSGRLTAGMLVPTAVNLQRASSFRSPLSTGTTSANIDEKHSPSVRGDSAASKSPDGHSVPASAIPGATLSDSDKMVILYTCRVCDTRSARTISKPSYQSGVVLVRCPGCNKLHLVADRLGFFGDESADVESLLAARGERVKRSVIGPQLTLAKTPKQSIVSSEVTSTINPASTSSAPAGSLAAATAALTATSDSGDAFVLEFSAEDVAVLRSSTKSLNLRTRSEAPAGTNSPAGSDSPASGS